MDQEVITISKSEYLRLQKVDEILEALYAGGVDNWEWYGASLENLEDEDNDS